MSSIFETSTTTRTRQDATIRVASYTPGSHEKAGYIQADLLEFHPDYNDRLTFTSYALIKATPELLALAETHPQIYQVQGANFLKEPYIYIREPSIHPADLKEMMDWCRTEDQALIIHPCLRPFPMFKRGARVVVVAYKDSYHDTTEDIGQQGTITEKSSPGGMSSVLLDDQERRMGFTSRGFPSIALREAPKQSK